MNHLYLPFICACLFGAVHSVWVPLNSYLLHLGERFHVVSSPQPTARLGLSLNERLEQAEGYRRTATDLSGFLDERPSYELGSLLSRQLPLLRDAERLPKLCQALASFRRALLKSPHEAKLHLAVAEAEALLPSWRVNCREFFSKLPEDKLSPSERLKHLRTIAPYSVREQYLAAGIYLLLGEKNSALELLRENQEINPHFTAEQRQFTYSLITSSPELSLALPRRYPEVLWWERHFSSDRRDDFLAWESIFRQALSEAVDDLVVRLRSKQLPQTLFSKSIKELRTTEVALRSSAFSRRLDELLAALYFEEGLQLWANVVQQRSNLQRIPILKARLKEDYTPSSGMLFDWLPDLEPRSVTFDLPGHSVGFFRPEGFIPELLILQSRFPDGGLDSRRIAFYASRDNRRYHPIQPAELVPGHVIDGRLSFAFKFPETDFRYFKIHFSDTTSRKRFSNEMRHLVQLYGRQTQ